MYSAQERKEMHTKLWSEYLKERGDLGNLCPDGRIILKWASNKCDVMVWTRLICSELGRDRCRGHHFEEAISSAIRRHLPFPTIHAGTNT
jgi:hypothetical protein